MHKILFNIMMICGVIVLASGCASTQKTVESQPGQTVTTMKTLETRFYTDDRERVDQEMKGNFGYISGTPVPEDRSQYKKTRKMYVLEVTKNVNEAVKVENMEIEPYQPSSTAQPLPPMAAQKDPQWTRPVAIPDLDSISKERAGGSVEEYVVQTGDTLQKISKKFYGTYRQWLKIYEANTDVLKDPNRIKPGIRIRIPMD